MPLSKFLLHPVGMHIPTSWMTAFWTSPSSRSASSKEYSENSRSSVGSTLASSRILPGCCSTWSTKRSSSSCATALTKPTASPSEFESEYSLMTQSSSQCLYCCWSASPASFFSSSFASFFSSSLEWSYCSRSYASTANGRYGYSPCAYLSAHLGLLEFLLDWSASTSHPS